MASSNYINDAIFRYLDNDNLSVVDIQGTENRVAAGNAILKASEFDPAQQYEPGYLDTNPISSAWNAFIGSRDAIYKALIGSGNYSPEYIRNNPAIKQKISNAATILERAQGNSFANLFRGRTDSNFLNDPNLTEEDKAFINKNIIDLLDKAYNDKGKLGTLLHHSLKEGDVPSMNNFILQNIIYPALGKGGTDIGKAMYGAKDTDTPMPTPKGELNKPQKGIDDLSWTADKYKEYGIRSNEESYGPNSALAKVPSLDRITKQIYDPNYTKNEAEMVAQAISAEKDRLRRNDEWERIIAPKPKERVRMADLW